MIELPKVGENIIIHAGYSDFRGIVLEITYKDKDKERLVKTIKLQIDKKGEEVVEIDGNEIYAITHLKK